MRKVVIYNDYRPEKYDLFIDELERQKIYDYEIFHCIKNQNHNIVEKISESFKTVIREAKENGDKEICIIEDDIMFQNEKGWEYFINNKPKNYDVYVGGSYYIDDRIVYKPPLVKVPEWTGNQCIIIHERYFDTWLSTDSLEHCDYAQSIKGGDFYHCFPMVALQRPGWSANHGNVVNYNPEQHPRIPKEYIY